MNKRILIIAYKLPLLLSYLFESNTVINTAFCIRHNKRNSLEYRKSAKKTKGINNTNKTIVSFVMMMLLSVWGFSVSVELSFSHSLLFHEAFAQQTIRNTTTHFIFKTNQQVYASNDNLVAYGKSVPNDVVLVTILDASQRAIKFDNIQTDKDGFFSQTIFNWPEPTKNMPFGLYTVVARSTAFPQSVQSLDVTFAQGSTKVPNDNGGQTVLLTMPVSHILAVKLDSPSEVPVGKPFRIFVQVTFDGALVDSDDVNSLLGSSHIHSGNSTLNLPSFKKLHEGLYYTDVTINREGSYIVHAVAFYKGFLSHDSRVVVASLTTISTIQDSVNQLRVALNSTNNLVDGLGDRINDARYAVNSSQHAITNSVEEARSSIGDDINSAKKAVDDLQQASGQVNSIFLPILALISVIIALQISLFARIRASYR